MNVKTISTYIYRIVNIVFLMLVGYLGHDEGIGAFALAFLVGEVFYILLLGGMEQVVSKMVHARYKRGFNSNARKVLRTGILVVLAVSIVISVFLTLLGNKISVFFIGNVGLSSVLVVICILILLQGLLMCLKGYFSGISNHGVVIATDFIYSIVLIISSTVIIAKMYTRGKLVSALLKNEIFSGINSSIGAYICLGITLLLCVIFLIGNLLFGRGTYGEASGTVRGMDSGRNFISNYIKVSLPVLEKNIFPLAALVIFVSFYCHGMAKNDASGQSILHDIGVMFDKYFISIMWPFITYLSYVKKECRKIKADYKKDEHGNVVIRSNMMIKNCFYVMLPVSVMLIVLAKPFVMVFFGGSMSMGVTMLRQGGIVVLFFAVSYVCKSILREIGLSLYSLLASIIGTVFGLLYLLPALNKNLSINIVVWTIVIYSFVQFVCSLLIIHRMVGLKLFDIGIKLGKIAVSSAIMAILIAILDKFIVMNVLFLLLTMIIGFAVFFVATSILQTFSNREIASLKGTLTYFPASFINGFLTGR